MKHCPTCDTTKPIEDFYRCKSRGDGRTGRCRICHNAAVRRTKSTNPAKYREIGRAASHKHYHRTKGAAHRAKWAAIAAEAAAAL